jgi:hypothetical protein
MTESQMIIKEMFDFVIAVGNMGIAIMFGFTIGFWIGRDK